MEESATVRGYSLYKGPAVGDEGPPGQTQRVWGGNVGARLIPSDARFPFILVRRGQGYFLREQFCPLCGSGTREEETGVQRFPEGCCHCLGLHGKSQKE